jgi:hypothetical protein
LAIVNNVCRPLLSPFKSLAVSRPCELRRFDPCQEYRKREPLLARPLQSALRH